MAAIRVRLLQKLYKDVKHCRSLVNITQNISNPEPQIQIYEAEQSLAGFNDYNATMKDFKWEVPEFYNFAEDVLEKWARAEQVNFTLIRVCPN